MRARASHVSADAWQAAPSSPMELPALSPEVAAALIRASALSALVAGGAESIELLRPHVEQSLQVSASGDVFVVDADGRERHGVAAKHVVAELALEWPHLFRRRP